ncbi:MAG TPA: hypothetical protein ENK43_10215 [Planctomycetes bacterium]|nr:hypothetical protein [Planctomycetota bacterium]
MPICPKCEEEYRDGFDVCADCGVPLVEAIAATEEIPEEEAVAAEELLADEEEEHTFCPGCFSEYRPDASLCAPCGGIRLQTSPTSAYERLLTTSVLGRHAGFYRPEEQGDLVRVLTVASPADAGFMVSSMEALGLNLVVGDDVLDADLEDPPRIGLYVAPEELEAARMALPEEAEIGEEDEEAGFSEDPYGTLLRQAGSWAGIHRYNQAILTYTKAAEFNPNPVDAWLGLGRVLGTLGQVDAAAKTFREVLALTDGQPVTEAPYLHAVYTFLDEEGHASFAGDAAKEALVFLDRFAAARVRVMPAQLLALEAHGARAEHDEARQVVARIRKLHPHFFELDGLYRTLASQMGLL